ncbi:PspC domain-containing protein [Williamwhitmania taraxaci]|uniref:Phage shock protein C (PspC) family protein n=1 Tax=Williamwhitmania taraxaci TaxID=1640674 RepID=A0A1G6H7W0_9BACT|nr:PspC domain-containing protein [Williamwhitmania taraxaci]SDB90234.1 phage shock protein C (PspC) family protein [Williamwhitmania taraxaci]
MKNTMNVNIGGQAFVIDEDAYHILRTYLESWEANLFEDPGKREILDDMESRIAEIFLASIKVAGTVVSISLVESAIKIMGKPDEAETFADTNTVVTPRAYRRIYRDTENRILGGVCSGISLYWRIDPIIFRLLFVLGVLFAGTGILIYLVLWIAIPKAITPAQKLEMRGEPITVENIRKAVTNEFNEVFSQKK